MVQLPSDISASLAGGCVIPAHPLALTAQRKLDERRQRALSRYYLAAGSGGLAVAVHTTQFAIRKPEIGLLRPVLELALEEMKAEEKRRGSPVLRIAGVVGRTAQAVAEAKQAHELGYHIGLLSLAALPDAADDALLDHCQAVAEHIPIMGFYLQPAVGGRVLSERFWARFCGLPAVRAIKVAPFNRYMTLDVVKGIAASGRAGGIALYTGNDDHILLDLLTPFRVPDAEGNVVEVRFVGGLLGHWAVWTKRAVEHLEIAREIVTYDEPVSADILAMANAVTDANAAVFDAANNYAGVIAGVHEVLRRQGLLAGTWCLDPHEALSPGQAAAIDRIYAAYPELTDDEFVRENIDGWMR